QLLALVHLFQLEDGARAPALRVRPLHEGVGEVLTEPASTAFGTLSHCLPVELADAGDATQTPAFGTPAPPSSRPRSRAAAGRSAGVGRADGRGRARNRPGTHRSRAHQSQGSRRRPRGPE